MARQSTSRPGEAWPTPWPSPLTTTPQLLAAHQILAGVPGHAYLRGQGRRADGLACELTEVDHLDLTA